MVGRTFHDALTRNDTGPSDPEGTPKGGSLPDTSPGRVDLNSLRFEGFCLVRVRTPSVDSVL